MIWKKRGLIFTPQAYGMEYAKSPQAVVFENYVRIYFSACKRDGSKWLSYACFADFSKDFHTVLKVSQQILPDGRLGCFDEHGIFPFSPVKVDDKIWAYTSGWSRRVSVSVETGIGLAESLDQGESFVRMGEGPVLTNSLQEPFLVMDGFVRRFQNKFHMWYIFGQDWKIFEKDGEPERIYKIGHGVSENGIDWERDGGQIITDVIPDESQALPCVIFYRDLYHMFFCYRHSYDFRKNRENSYRIGYACSENLREWIRDDKRLNFVPPEEGWDSQMQCYPNAFEMNHKLYLLYNGNEFGRNGFGLAELEEY